MVNSDAIREVLGGILDPEMPIGIVDLGLVEDVRIEDRGDGADVHVDLLPTFVGCIAQPMIADEVRRRVGAMDEVGSVTVAWHHDPPWTIDRITEGGRRSLREHGISVPGRTNGPACGAAGHESVVLRTSVVTCPWCRSSRTRLESPFGPTRCRMIFTCDACRNTFERMKRVE